MPVRCMPPCVAGTRSRGGAAVGRRAALIVGRKVSDYCPHERGAVACILLVAAFSCPMSGEWRAHGGRHGRGRAAHRARGMAAYGHKKSSRHSSAWMLSAAFCRRDADADGLFSVVLVRYCQFLAAMSAALGQYAATILCSHSLTEAVLVHSPSVVRLKCSFHCSVDLFYLLLFTLRAAKLLISFELTKKNVIFSLNI